MHFRKIKQFGSLLFLVAAILILDAPVNRAFATAFTCEQLFQSEIFTQAVLDIQKDLMGNRPLIAIIRGTKKKPEVENALVELVRGMPAPLKDSFFENTGYDIDGLKIILKKEMKISRNWEIEFTKKMLELVNSGVLGGVVPPVDWYGYKMTTQELNSIVTRPLTTAIQGLLGTDKVSWKKNRELMDGIVKLASSQDADFYFLLESKMLIDRKKLEIYKTQSDLTPEMAVGRYNEEHSSSVAVTADDIAKGRDRLINQIEFFAQRARQFMDSAAKQDATSPKEDPVTEERHVQRSTSLQSLIDSMTPADAAVVSQYLVELIRSVDSSERQQNQIEQALNSIKPQLALLKISYDLKQKRELTQSEIQTAVFLGLDEVTKVTPSETHSMLTQQVLSAHSVYIHEHSQETTAADVLAAKGSKARIEHVKNLLLINSNSSKEPFNLVIQNEKEFFEVFKPGTNGFNRLESDLDTLNQKLARVFKYFSGHLSQETLAGDGHFSIAHKNIFSLRWGEYRLLIMVEKSGATPQLVILSVYNKGDEGGNFYEVAESRRIHRQP